MWRRGEGGGFCVFKGLSGCTELASLGWASRELLCFEHTANRNILKTILRTL